jgi:uncharacterized protein
MVGEDITHYTRIYMGDIFFPFQLVFFLNEPDDDYTGREYVLTEQIPRAQSKAVCLKTT